MNGKSVVFVANNLLDVDIRFDLLEVTNIYSKVDSCTGVKDLLS